jgi:NADH:ubiquinone oxidoreductase subunit F (NADH-binding)
MTVTASPPATGGPIAPVGRLLAAPTTDLAEHERLHGPLPVTGHPGALLPRVEAAGLTGRGGAGFSSWRKLAAVASGPRPVVIANGAEGEPASSKDRTLLMTVPHLVLDGLQVAADIVGATSAYVYVAPGPALQTTASALAARRKARRDPVKVTLIEAPDTFLSGQETAVLAAIEGRPAVPKDMTRRIVESGLRGRPTLVNNVETLAHLAQIAQHGATWFRRYGTDEEPGTFLASISGPLARPGVYEVAHGTPLNDVLARAGGPTEPLQAVLVGGYHGTWIPIEKGWRAPMSRAGLAPFGASVGAGVIVPLATGVCGLVESANVVAYLAEQSAQQCGPCLNGLPRIAETVTKLAQGTRSRSLVNEVERVARLVENRGACRHPDGTVRFVRSTLSVFAAEVNLHLNGYCTAAGRK